MSTFASGRPVRSNELRQKSREMEGRARDAHQRADDLEHQLQQLHLALHTKTRRLPTDTPSGDGNPRTLYLPTQAGAGAEIESGVITTARTERHDAVYEGATGVGEMTLLHPGKIWAGLSPERRAGFEARLQPAYLSEYNEIILPHVAGENLVWRLFHSNGFEEVKAGSQTVIKRFDRLQEFNGRAELISTSETGFRGEYIHTAGGIQLLRSEWMDTGTVQAERRAEFTGDVRLDGLYMYPGKRAVTDFDFAVDGQVISPGSTVSLTPESELSFTFDISGHDAVSYVSCDFVPA